MVAVASSAGGIISSRTWCVGTPFTDGDLVLTLGTLSIDLSKMSAGFEAELGDDRAP